MAARRRGRVSKGDRDEADEMFELAEGLEDEVSSMLEAAQRMRDILAVLRPGDLNDSGEGRR